METLFLGSFLPNLLFFWLRDDVLGDRTHPDHTRYVDFLNALMMVAIMKMMMAMMTVCGINPKHHHHQAIVALRFYSFLML